ncbi:CAP domain-containing protein [Clostridium sp.]|uniref:CAP domain-containing protein n=1 Tax=Clostridium sp. TaxID=1506 RepID=UPI00260F75FA|nr:CAP domain-containing protein [Clostridium sp.]
MKKTFFTKTTKTVVAAAIIAMLPLGVSAEWKENSDMTWSYPEGSTIIKGWKNISNVWYYFNSDGKMQVGWICDKGNWYYLNHSGEMLDGWVDVNGSWYYFDGSGAMKTGWLKDNNSWYYLDYEDGMQTGTVNLNGISYHFNESGRLQNIINSNQTTNESTYNSQKVSGQVTKNYTQRTTQSNNSNGTSSNTYISGLPQLPNNYTVSIQESAENEILKYMNEKRTQAGLQPLVIDNTLLQEARYKSNHMIQYDYFDHTTPQGNDWTSWLKIMGYKYTITGENIAYNNYDPVQLFDQWWNSPGHRANMMNSSYHRVGIGVLYGNDKYMGTQTFSN